MLWVPDPRALISLHNHASTLCALHNVRSSEEETDLTGPPQYDATYLVNESPPVYEDALQDIVIATGKYEVSNSLCL